MTFGDAGVITSADKGTVTVKEVHIGDRLNAQYAFDDLVYAAAYSLRAGLMLTVLHTCRVRSQREARNHGAGTGSIAGQCGVMIHADFRFPE